MWPLDIHVVASWNLWNHADERHHAWNHNGQHGTVDVVGMSRISSSIGVDGVRDGLTEGLKGAEEATGACR